MTGKVIPAAGSSARNPPAGCQSWGAILAISVSGFKLYKSIVKDKRKENVKIEIIRHTIFSALMTILLCLSSVVEVFVSNNLLKIIVKYL